MLRILTKLGLILFLSSNLVHALTINADQLAVGTDVTVLNNIGKLSMLSGTTEKTVYIQKDSESQRNTIGTSTGVLDEIAVCNYFLCGRPWDNHSTGLLIEIANSINLFSFKGFDRSTDSFEILFFDDNDALIEHQHPLQRTIRYYNCGNPSFQCQEYNYFYEATFDLGNVRKIYFGGSSAGAYITEINIRVPEPTTLILLVFSLLFIGLSTHLKRDISQKNQTTLNN